MKTEDPKLRPAGLLSLFNRSAERPLIKPPDIWKDLATIAILAVSYLILGRLGLLFSFTRPSFTPVLLPSGIAVAALLIFGYRVWPGVLLGAFAVELTIPSDLNTSLLLAASNTLESLAGAWLANRYAGGRNFFMHPRDVIRFTVLVGILTPLISPPLGARVVSWNQFILWANDAPTGLIWWLGDSVSMLVLTPLILAWSGRPYQRWNLKQALEFVLLMLLLLVVCEVVFGPAVPASARGYLLPYLCLPLLFWAAFRFSEREMATATCVLGAVAMWNTLHGYGLLAQFTLATALLVCQGFMAFAAVMTMCLGAVVGQRRRATEELQKAYHELELQVQQRTEALQAEISEHKLAEEDLRESEYRYVMAQRAANIGSWDWNIQTGKLHWSAQIEPMFGFPSGRFERTYQAFLERVHPEDRHTVTNSIDAAVHGHKDYGIEHRIIWPDGTVRWVSEVGEVHRSANGTPIRMLGIVRDITGRKQMQQALENANERLRTANENLRAATEELHVSNETLERRVAVQTAEVRQTNQILRMIWECNQALVHISDERRLIEEICRIINDVGGYRMAWVGCAETDKEKAVRPVAAVGFGEGYLDTIRVSWADNKFGRGPTGTAVRTGKVCIAKDFVSDPRLEPWRKLALERGFRSSIALPLLVKERVFGALSIYAHAPDAFDQKQINLLTDLANDMAFGITALRARAERDRAREELEQKTVQLGSLTAELAQAEERERRRIACVLHDGIQQLLVGARYGVETLRGQSQTEAFQQAIQHVDGLLGRCLETSRSLTLELSPPILYEAGLAPALNWLGRWFLETHGLLVNVVAEDQTLSGTEDIRAALFHAVRELLFNVVKHAKVKSAKVRMCRLENDRIKILVMDKGAGFEPAKLQAREGMAGGFGLFSLGERLRSLGGQFEVESAPGLGSRFTLIVPSGPINC